MSILRDRRKGCFVDILATLRLHDDLIWYSPSWLGRSTYLTREWNSYPIKSLHFCKVCSFELCLKACDAFVSTSLMSCCANHFLWSSLNILEIRSTGSSPKEHDRLDCSIYNGFVSTAIAIVSGSCPCPKSIKKKLKNYFCRKLLSHSWHIDNW